MRRVYHKLAIRFLTLFNLDLRHSLFVLDVSVAAGEVSLVAVDAAVELGALEGASAARVAEYRMLVVHRQTHLELLLVTRETTHLLDVLHVPASSDRQPSYRSHTNEYLSKYWTDRPHIFSIGVGRHTYGKY